ncbi:MAG TPA: murein biosynthesis integral membrane protein MurJ [Actinomycetota bacterium]|nr:murein biosynthesis integral membrane protein MurJ [Actinomycetota bacterium]
MAAAAVGGTPSLARGAALITIATGISRLTGFVRVVVVAGAMGTTFLANTYQTANTAPNVIFELVAAGVLTSVFVPTFVSYVASGRREAGWEAANALTSVALAGLLLLSGALVLAAPMVMRVLTLGVTDPVLREQEIALGAKFLRLFAPQILLYGAGMIMTAVLHAHRRFALAAMAPIFNNVVVIAVYLSYAAMRGDEPPTIGGISDAETFLLGAGTTAGVVAMTVCLIPQLRGLGWRFRLRWQPSHPAVRQGARVGVWALGYAGGYQAGLVVVLLLANRIEGGVAAYQWAYTFFYLPHALFAVPIFAVLFTAMSEHAAAEDPAGIVARLRSGLAMMAFVLVPVAFALMVLSDDLAKVTLGYGVMTAEGARLVGRVIATFALGLPAYSAFLIFTRAFYALADAKRPALMNALSVALASALGVLLFFLAPTGWEIAGLALGHSIGFSAGAILLGRGLGRRLGRIFGTHVVAAWMRAGFAGTAALAVMALLSWRLPGGPGAASALTLAVAGTSGAVVYLAVMRWVGSPELARVGELVRGTR